VLDDDVEGMDDACKQEQQQSTNDILRPDISMFITT
jgi:hypothetical protein